MCIILAILFRNSVCKLFLGVVSIFGADFSLVWISICYESKMFQKWMEILTTLKLVWNKGQKKYCQFTE